jgi:hypothetical protein
LETGAKPRARTKIGKKKLESPGGDKKKALFDFGVVLFEKKHQSEGLSPGASERIRRPREKQARGAFLAFSGFLTPKSETKTGKPPAGPTDRDGPGVRMFRTVRPFGAISKCSAVSIA